MAASWSTQPAAGKAVKVGSGVGSRRLNVDELEYRSRYKHFCDARNSKRMIFRPFRWVGISARPATKT
jgi:hypothetical protein